MIFFKKKNKTLILFFHFFFWIPCQNRRVNLAQVLDDLQFTPPVTFFSPLIENISIITLYYNIEFHFRLCSGQVNKDDTKFTPCHLGP